VLVTADTPEGTQPLVVTHRYGQGKVAALYTDSLWKWQLSPEAASSRPYQRFWSQLVGWLLPREEALQQEAVELFADRSQLFLGEAIELHARLGEDAGADDARLECVMVLPDQRRVPYAMTRRQVATPSGQTFPGFSLRFRAEAPGMHLAMATARLGEEEVQSRPLSFYVKPYSPEMQPRPIQAGVLRDLAEGGGGRFFEGLEEMDETLSAFSPPVVEEETAAYFTLWRNWAMLGLLMTVLAGSWTVRKFRNMP
jgi:hypothetical protein